MSLTIDASVFVSAALPSEVQFSNIGAFLNKIRLWPRVLHRPTLLVPETAASLARCANNAGVGQNSVRWVTSFPGMNLISLDLARVLQAARLAATYRMRGADAVYVAVAQEIGTTLITWDAEMLSRGAQAVAVMTPSDWLAANRTI